jgi:outer membrane protein assembly factor BamB
VELGSVVALDKKTGKRIWKCPINGDCWSTPRLIDLPGGKKELILNGSGAVYGIDPDSGKELWQVETVSGHISSTPLLQGGLIYVMNSSLAGKHVQAIRPGGRGEATKTHLVWRQPKAGASHCSPLLVGDRFVYFSGQATALSLSDGSILQQERLDGIKNLYASPILVGDKIILFTRDAGGYVLDAKNLAVLAHNDLGDSSAFNASPALSNGRLYIRSNQYLYCIGPGK